MKKKKRKKKEKKKNENENDYIKKYRPTTTKLIIRPNEK